MRKATATFIHAGDVNIARGKVAGNLDIADKRSAAGYLPRIRPGEAIVSRISNEERE